MLIVCDNAKESCPIFPGPGSRINAEEVNKRRLAEKKRFERKFEALVGALNDFTSAYNAGRGRVQEWIARFGDPRDPKVDPVDWVERIPFMETRNYVQRVMENMQVYRTRFGAAPLTIETDLRRGASTAAAH